MEYNKKKCLIIIPGVPFPPIDGHKLKIFNVIKILSKYYDLHLVTISNNNLSSQQTDFIKEHSYKNKHFKLNRLFALFRVLSAIFYAIPYQVAYFTLPGVKRYLEKESADDELVMINLVRVAEYLKNINNKDVIFDMVDALSTGYLKSRKSTSSIIYKLIYTIEARRLIRYEKETVKKANVTLCVNPFDAKHFGKFGSVKWIPNGVKSELFSYTNKSEEYKNCIAFFGTMNYQPNVDAVLWFDKYVLDHLNPDIHLFIVGAKPNKQVINIAKKRSNVTITGFMDDPYLILNSCFAIIAPMQNGGGIQNKILETMGMGKINVLTSYAARPVQGANNNVHFLVDDEPVKMAEIINDININPDKYNAIAHNAKTFIEHNYTWDAYESMLIQSINHSN